ncbi:unnamed protein product, partial [Medioppia subpectinata]
MSLAFHCSKTCLLLCVRNKRYAFIPNADPCVDTAIEHCLHATPPSRHVIRDRSLTPYKERDVSAKPSLRFGLSSLGKLLMAAAAIANVVKSSLGPIGLDKMLVDDIGDVTITNDGATILGLLEVEHPAAKVLVDLAQLQDQEV